MGGEPLQGEVLVPGRARGEVLALVQPLSLWGGLDVASGVVVDRRHPQRGALVTGKVLVMPSGRGSSSSSSILAEAIRRSTGPCAILLGEPDHIIGLGAMVARELYGLEVPVAVLPQDDYRAAVSARWVEVDPAGRVWVDPPSSLGG